MALADSGRAIGRVTALLRDRLEAETGILVSVGRPEPAAGNGGPGEPRLNLFLYETQFDATLRNHVLDEGLPPPMWLVLRFLLTAFDTQNESDTMEALDQLGTGLSALQEMNFLRPLHDALRDNPEPLKLTFDEVPVDALSKLMQGPDSRYRFSMAFQVRPVMVATGEIPSFAPVVGVDTVVSPPVVIGERGIRIPVLPSLGPVLTAIEPASLVTGGTLVARGNDLHLSGMALRLGGADLPVVMQRPDVLRAQVDPMLLPPGPLRAGSHPVAAVQVLSPTRRRSSNLLIATLLPTVSGAETAGVHAVGAGLAAGTIDLSGRLLGGPDDDVYLALYRDGGVTAVFDAGFTFAEDQATLSLSIADADAVPAGEYLAILRVNGAQARQSPLVSLVP